MPDQITIHLTFRGKALKTYRGGTPRQAKVGGVQLPGNDPVGGINQITGDTTIPLAPLNVLTTSDVYLDKHGDYVATINVTWNEVKLNTDGSPVTDPGYYEIQYRPGVFELVGAYEGGYPVGYSDPDAFNEYVFVPEDDWTNEIDYWAQAEPGFHIIDGLAPATAYQVRVRAVDGSLNANRSAWSSVVELTTAEDEAAPSQPKKPFLDDIPLGIIVEHRLGIEGDADFVLERDLDHLLIYADTTSPVADNSLNLRTQVHASASHIDTSTPVYAAFPVSVTDPNGTTWHVAVKAVDMAGNVSALSPEESIVVSGVSAGQLADNAIDAAQLAPGLTFINVVSSFPGSPSQGDVVFLTTDKKLYRYDGTQWTAEVDGADIAANSIQAGQIAAGAIGADELAANSVLAKHLTVADFSNILKNGDFEAGTIGGPDDPNQYLSTGYVESGDAYRGSRAVQITSDTGSHTLRFNGAWSGVEDLIERSPASEGDIFSFWCYFKRDGTSPSAPNPFRLIMEFIDENGSVISNLVSGPSTSSTSYTKFSYGDTNPSNAAPAGTVAVDFKLDILPDPNEVTYTLDRFYARRRGQGSLVVDGAVTADSFSGNSLTIGTAADPGQVQLIGEVELVQTGGQGLVITGFSTDDDGFTYNNGTTIIDGGKITAGTITLTGSDTINIPGIDHDGNTGQTIIDGGYIQTETIESESIKSRSITSDRIVIGSYENLIPNPRFDSSDVALVNHATNGAGGTWSVAVGVDNGNNAAQFSAAGATADGYLALGSRQVNPIEGGDGFSVFPGDVFGAKVRRRWVTAAPVAVVYQLSYFDKNGGLIDTAFAYDNAVTNTFQSIVFEFDKPAPAASSFGVVQVIVGSAQVQTAKFQMAAIEVKRVLESSYIQNLTVDKLSAGTLDVEIKMTSNGRFAMPDTVTPQRVEISGGAEPAIQLHSDRIGTLSEANVQFWSNGVNAGDMGPAYQSGTLERTVQLRLWHQGLFVNTDHPAGTIVFNLDGRRNVLDRGGIQIGNPYVSAGMHITTPNNQGNLLSIHQINETADQNPLVQISHDKGPTAGKVYLQMTSYNQGGTQTDSFKFFRDGGAEASGPNAGWFVPSDRRLKTDISPLQNALGHLDDFRIYKYRDEYENWRVGVMGQDLEKVLPSAVIRRHTGRLKNQRLVTPDEVVWVTVRALQQIKEFGQDARADINQLQTVVTTLWNDVQTLKGYH